LFSILKLLPKVDIFVFAQNSDIAFLPILLARLAGKKVILRSDERPSLLVKKYFHNPGKIKIALIRIGETLGYTLANKILPESKGMIDLYEMHSYDHKIHVGGQYVDTTNFRETKKLIDRTYDMGYIGRLISEKGALQFIQSLPLILKDKQAKVIVIGDGDLRDEIEQILEKNDIRSKIELLDWVDNKQLPQYLNNIRLVVVPSDYEGLPNLVLESMACGTPVLATPVGGVPDIIREGETGFIMKDNSPECIAENVVRVLSHPDLEQIRKNAHNLIKREYTYEAAVARYKNVLESLN
jgi:glycosyltransferase involved in cell wall biosynthesis